MAFAVAGAVGDERLVEGDAGCLGCFGQAVDIGHEGDDRLAGALFSDPRGGQAGDAAGDRKPFFSRIPVTYSEVSISWYPSSLNEKMESTICCVKVRRPSTISRAACLRTRGRRGLRRRAQP